MIFSIANTRYQKFYLVLTTMLKLLHQQRLHNNCRVSTYPTLTTTKVILQFER